MQLIMQSVRQRRGQGSRCRAERSVYSVPASPGRNRWDIPCTPSLRLVFLTAPEVIVQGGLSGRATKLPLTRQLSYIGVPQRPAKAPLTAARRTLQARYKERSRVRNR